MECLNLHLVFLLETTGDLLVAAINSQKSKKLLKATKWAAFQTDWRMFKYFK